MNRASRDHDLFSYAAAMAFFLLFSLPALVIVLVVLAEYVPVERAMRRVDADLVEEICQRVEAGMPDECAALVGGFVRTYFDDGRAAAASVFRKPAVRRAGVAVGREGPGAGLERALRDRRPSVLLVGFLFVLWSASGATRAAMSAMDRIHGTAASSLVRLVKSVVLTVGLGLGILCVIAVLPLGNVVAESVAAVRGLGPYLVVGWQGVNWVVGLGLLYLLVAALQRHGPSIWLDRREVRVGACVTVVLWVALSLALKLWTEHGWDSFGATYGPMAGIAVLLMWCFLSSVALLLGVEVNAASLRGRSKGRERTVLRFRPDRRSPERAA